jgi:HSP20 family protein
MSEQVNAKSQAEAESGLATVQEQRQGRREPATLLDEMQADLARLLDFGSFPVLPFGRALRRVPQLSAASMPRVDVFEREGSLVVKAEVPGVKKDDIDLEVVDGDLVLRAERHDAKEVRDEHWYRMERSSGSLYRRLPLPEGVAIDHITANLSDGVLEIILPKPHETAPQSQKIAIS